MAKWPLFAIDIVAIVPHVCVMDMAKAPQRYDESKGLSLRVPFRSAEAEAFRAFLKRHDKKAAAFARTAILAAMAREEGAAVQPPRSPEKYETAAGMKVPGRPV